MNYYAGYDLSDEVTPIAVFESEEDRDAWVKDTLKSECEMNNEDYEDLKMYEPYYGVKRIPLTYEQAHELTGNCIDFDLDDYSLDAYFEQIKWFYR